MECGNDEKARAAMREEMITRQKLADAYPEWALTPPVKWSQTELRNTLEALANRHPAGNIAADALALSRMRIKDRYRPEIDGEFIGFGAVLSWREDDLTVRIYDDLLQFAYQAEFCDLIGEVEFNLDEPQTLRSWQRDMRARFQAIRLIDGLIYKLSERN
jgi:PRTRC genetic system protein F